MSLGGIAAMIKKGQETIDKKEESDSDRERETEGDGGGGESPGDLLGRLFFYVAKI